jgi:hypothetical protein
MAISYRKVFRAVSSLQHRYKVSLVLTFAFMNIQFAALLPLLKSSQSLQIVSRNL